MTQDDSLHDLLRAVASAPPRRPPPCGVLGERFELERKLGEGTFGIVYKAFDRRTGCHVAIKVLRDDRADWLYRFKREFRAFAELSHPNLVSAYELFHVNRVWFFSMELLSGADFVSRVRYVHPRTPLLGAPVDSGFDEPLLRDAFAQLLDGLAAVHAAGKVHRDLKPSNVMITSEGRVAILDFGLVTASLGTWSSSMAGTPDYMSPEQAGSRTVGPASDLYSAGLILYEALTGVLPFQGTAIEVLSRRLHEQPAEPRQQVGSLPADLNELCTALLQRDPGARLPAAENWRRRNGARLGSARVQAPHVFGGQAQQLSSLRKAREATEAGQVVGVLVQGESGSGRSRLVGHFLEDLARHRPDATLLAGRCVEREMIPFQALDEIVDTLSSLLGQMPGPEAAAIVPVFAAELVRVFPVLLRVPQLARYEFVRPTSCEPRLLRKRAFTALRALLRGLAKQSLTIVVIEDLHRTDDETLQLLSELLCKPESPSLLFLATVGADSEGLLRVQGRFRRMRVISLGPLDDDARSAPDRRISV